MRKNVRQRISNCSKRARLGHRSNSLPLIRLGLPLDSFARQKVSHRLQSMIGWLEWIEVLSAVVL